MIYIILDFKMELNIIISLKRKIIFKDIEHMIDTLKESISTT